MLPVLGDAPSGPTVRRALDLARSAMLERIAGARAKARAHVWKLIEATPPGSRGWSSPGRRWPAGWSSTWTGTLITARSDKEGAAPTLKKGYGLLTELREVFSQFSGHVV